MLKKFSLLLIVVLALAGCASQPAADPAPPVEEIPANPPTEVVVEAPTELPTEAPQPTPTLVPTDEPTPEPTPTLVPTETPLPTETAMPEAIEDPNLFGSVNVEDAPVGFMLEPVAQFIFEAEMQKIANTGEISGFQTEGLSIVPRGDGTFFAEIFYAVQADASYLPEDFGTSGDDGWVRGKCTRFDFEITETAYFLKNKAICN